MLLLLLYDKLIKREVLANPERWEVQHDSQSWLDANGWEAEYAINPLTGEKNVEKLDHLTLNRIGQEPRFNEKIVLCIVIFFVIYLGVSPDPLFKLIDSSTNNIIYSIQMGIRS